METSYEQRQLITYDPSGDVVIGMSDGLIIPFALATGLSGAVETTSIVVIAVLAEITAGAIAMGIGGYFAARSEKYQQDVLVKSIDHSGSESNEEGRTKTFFANLGLSESFQEKAVEEVLKDKEKWSEVVKMYDQSAASAKTLSRSALTIGISYVAGGLIPLAPYFFFNNTGDALKISVIVTLFLLLVFGWFKAKINGKNPWWGALWFFVAGSLAAAAAYGVANIFISM